MNSRGYMRFLRAVLTVFLVVILGSCISWLLNPEVEVELTELRSGQYSLDKLHASVLFKIQHMGLSTYVGRFNEFDATLDFDPEDMASTKLDAVIDIASLDINDPGLKDDLMGRTWFDQASYPQAIFSTLSVTPVTESEFEFLGNLEWRGVSKPVSLFVTFHGGADNFLTGKYTLGFSAKGSLLRSEFGMDAYIPTVGDEIQIETYAEFQRN